MSARTLIVRVQLKQVKVHESRFTTPAAAQGCAGCDLLIRAAYGTCKSYCLLTFRGKGESKRKYLLAARPRHCSRGGGCIQGSASEATVVALLAGRSCALKGRSVEDHGRLVVYPNRRLSLDLPMRIVSCMLHHHTVRMLPKVTTGISFEGLCGL